MLAQTGAMAILSLNRPLSDISTHLENLPDVRSWRMTKGVTCHAAATFNAILIGKIELGLTV